MSNITQLIQSAMQYSGILILVIGILAFCVSVVVQAIKEVALFKPVPTDLLVLVLSIVFTIVAVVIMCTLTAMAITWYIIFISLIVGFFVSEVATNGWSKITSIYNRCKKTNSTDQTN